jgi:hypothetical protein
VNLERTRVSAIVAAAGLALALSACAAAGPTPIYRYQTPAPTPTGTPTPVVTATPTPTPEPTPTGTPSGGPGASASTAAATPTPEPTPTGPAGGCSGSALNQAFFADAANRVPFAVYCGVMPGGWYLGSAQDAYGPTGWVKATYSGPGGATIAIQEGAFCTSGSSACSAHDSVLGSAHFGDLSGTLDSLGPNAGFALYVGAGTTHGYTATGTSVSQATFVGIVGALIRVPQS